MYVPTMCTSSRARHQGFRGQCKAFDRLKSDSCSVYRLYFLNILFFKFKYIPCIRIMVGRLSCYLGRKYPLHHGHNQSSHLNRMNGYCFDGFRSASSAHVCSQERGTHTRSHKHDGTGPVLLSRRATQWIFLFLPLARHSCRKQMQWL